MAGRPLSKLFSDPVGEKLAFLKSAAQAGYNTILCFIGTAGPEVCEQRVAMRVSQGGHDVPTEKLVQRFPPHPDKPQSVRPRPAERLGFRQ